MIMMGMGQSAAEAEFLGFSRVQEATADQMGQRFLRETHQSGLGMVHVFDRMANESASAGIDEKAYASDHPADRDRVALLQEEADASPYRDVPDSPAVHPCLRDGQGQGDRLSAAAAATCSIAIRSPTTASRRATRAPWSICDSRTFPRRWRRSTA